MPARSGAQHAERGTGGGGGTRGTGIRRGEQRQGAQHRRLQRPPRSQVEEVGEVRRGGDDGAADEGVERGDVVAAAVGERGRGEPGEADADDLDQPGGHLAAGGRAEVALEPLARAVAGEVVERTERAGPEDRDDPRGPGRGGADAAPAT